MKTIRIFIALIVALIFVYIYPELPFRINVEFDDKTPDDHISSLSSNAITEDLLDSVALDSGGWVDENIEEYRYIKATPKAEIIEVWLEPNVVSYDLYGNAVKGFFIHVNLKIHNCEGQECKVVAFFWGENYNGDILGKRERYQTTSGTACVSRSIGITYTHSVWEDLSLFMPYEELICSGTKTISYMVVIRDKDNNELGRKQNLSFIFKTE